MNIFHVTGVATQGRNFADNWITSYKIQYSTDGITFTDYNGGQVFTGNTDRNTVVRHNLNTPITARYIRFNPQSWYTWISGRFEVYIQ